MKCVLKDKPYQRSRFHNPFSMDEDKVSFAIIAAVIDPENEDMLLGPATEAVYLKYKYPKSYLE